MASNNNIGFESSSFKSVFSNFKWIPKGLFCFLLLLSCVSACVVKQTTENKAPSIAEKSIEQNDWASKIVQR